MGRRGPPKVECRAKRKPNWNKLMRAKSNNHEALRKARQHMSTFWLIVVGGWYVIDFAIVAVFGWVVRSGKCHDEQVLVCLAIERDLENILINVGTSGRDRTRSGFTNIVTQTFVLSAGHDGIFDAKVTGWGASRH